MPQSFAGVNRKDGEGKRLHTSKQKKTKRGEGRDKRGKGAPATILRTEKTVTIQSQLKFSIKIWEGEEDRLVWNGELTRRERKEHIWYGGKKKKKLPRSNVYEYKPAGKGEHP